MKLSYKYRIYLNAEQAKLVQQNMNFCNFLYNSALQERKQFYTRFGKSTSYYSQCEALPLIKQEFPEQTSTIYSQSLQFVLKRLDSAYQNFFRRVKSGQKPGFPRFKNQDRFKSITFPQCDLHTGGIRILENKKLKIFGILGEVKIKWHRPFKGRCKQVHLVKQADRFYIVLSCDDVPVRPLARTGNEIGIDMGIESFITMDDGAVA